MKKFFTVAFLVLSMTFFVSCGSSSDDEKGENNGDKTDADQTDTEQTDDSDADTGSGDNGGNDNGQTDDNGDSDGDGGKTDTGDSADDNDADTGDSANDEDNTDTGDNNEVIDDSNCETVVYKSNDVLKMEKNEIDIWFYNTETFEDETPPLFFIEARFSKDVTELKGETVSLKNLDPNKEDGTLVFFYTDFDSSMWWFKKNYIAKSGSFHIEDVDAEDYTKLKIDTTAIVFYELAIDEENGVYTEVENGKCYKLEPLEWDSMSSN